MGRTFIRQDEQVRNSVTYDDALAVGVGLESQTNIEGDLNALRSQTKRVLWADVAGNWYDDINTVGTRKRGILALNTDLADIEDKRFLFRGQVMTDLTEAAAAAATGTLNHVAKANLVDADEFTLNDGAGNIVHFIYDVTGTYTPGGGYDATHVRVNVSGDTTADDVKTTTNTAINGATIGITASSGGSGISTLTNDVSGGAGNIAITEAVADPGFTVVGMSGGAGNFRVLVVASSEAPTVVAAVGAGSAEGAVVASLTGDVGIASLAEVTGPDAISPKNLCLIRDAVTGDPITSGNREVYGLLQAESGVVDGDTFNDTTKQVQISFVRINSTGDDLERVPAADMSGKTFNYAYARRVMLDNIPEYAFLTGAFLDQVPASVSVTLDNAIDNQVGPATQTDRNIEWRISDTYYMAFEDSTGARAFIKFIPNVAGDEVEINTDTLDINNALDADFLNGATFDSGGTSINVGVTAGKIDSAGALTLESAAANDLTVKSGDDLFFDDGFRAASSYSTPIKLAASSAEWTAFETAYGGEVSLLAALTTGRMKKKVAVVTSAVPANNNVTGAGGTPNIDVQLLAYSAATFVDTVNIYLNGVLLRNGANAAANHDVYPGTTPANGDLMFEFNLVAAPGNPDVITMELYG